MCVQVPDPLREPGRLPAEPGQGHRPVVPRLPDLLPAAPPPRDRAFLSLARAEDQVPGHGEFNLQFEQL